MHFWFFRKHRATMQEVLGQLAKELPLANSTIRKLPVLLVFGHYFDFPVSIELRKRKGFVYRVIVELPEPFEGRIFLQSEQRKTKFKPVADLTWVATPDPRFNQQFLLLADDEKPAKAVLTHHLCQQILALTETDWQFDLHGDRAYLDLKQSTLTYQPVAVWLRQIFDIINIFVVTTRLKQNLSK